MNPKILTHLLLGTVSVIGLTGCFAPEYKVPEISLPSDVSMSPPKSTSIVLPHKWWREIRDPDLNRLAEQALAQNYTLQSAGKRLEQAEAGVASTRSSLFPFVSPNVSTLRTRSPGPFAAVSQAEGSIGISWMIDIFGRGRRQLEIAEAMSLTAHEAKREAGIVIAHQVASTYFEARSVQAQLTLTKELLQRFNGYLVQIKQSGAASPATLAQFQFNIDQIGLELTRLRISFEQLENTLRALAADPSFKLSKFMKVDAFGKIRTPSSIPSEMLKARPDVRRAEQAISAAYAAVGLANSAYFPSLTIQASKGTAWDSSLAQAFGPQAWGISSLSASLAGPLLDAGGITARIQGAKSAAEQAEIDYKGTLLNAFLETRNALVTIAASRKSVAEMEAALVSMDEALALTSEEIKTQPTEITNLILLLQQQQQLRGSLFAARVKELSSISDLYRALGAPVQD